MTTQPGCSRSAWRYLELYFTNPFVNAGKLTLNVNTSDHERNQWSTVTLRRHDRPHHGPGRCAKNDAEMGEGTTFVLSSSGHLQSLINPPPTNPKASS